MLPDSRSFRMTFAGAWLALGIASAAPGRAADALPPHVTRALVVSIDGLRPDVLLRANTPVLHGLMRRGSFTMWARTTAVAVTLPSHVSMLTGLTPSHHGIVWNSDLPLAHPIYPSRPTLMELAHNAGLTTAMATGKKKFAALAKPGTLDWVSVPPDSSVPDAAVADTVVGWIQRHAPQVMFVHLPDVDRAGHDFGWGSPAQLAAAAVADRSLGRMLAALARRGRLDSTLVLVSADHGGAGRGHGPDDPRSRAIPWILAGPDIRANFDLTQDASLDVNTEDTFATICDRLGLDPRDAIDGKPIRACYSDRPATPAPPQARR